MRLRRGSSTVQRTETRLAVHKALQGSTEKWDRGTRMRGAGIASGVECIGDKE